MLNNGTFIFSESEMGKIGGEMDKTTTAPEIDDKPAQLKLKATKPKEKIETPMERLKRLENGNSLIWTDELLCF